MIDKLKLLKLEKLISEDKKEVKEIKEVKKPEVSENEIKLQIEVKENKEYIARLEKIVNQIDVSDSNDDEYIV